MPTYNDAYLAHYGKKGMKWGVRKNRNSPQSSKQREPLTKEQGRAAGAAISATLLAYYGSKLMTSIILENR